MAAVAPAAARSCFPLAVRFDARGRLLSPEEMLAIPVLVRLLVLAAVGAVAPDTLLELAATGLWGLGPERMLPIALLVIDAGGSGRGRGAEEIVL
jgi:hypothetical protein